MIFVEPICFYSRQLKIIYSKIIIQTTIVLIKLIKSDKLQIRLIEINSLNTLNLFQLKISTFKIIK
jgi:hypothetical protein